MAGRGASHEVPARLSADRAFVVHFGGIGHGRTRFTGRVEHLASGRAMHFASLRELLSFVRLLVSPQPQPQPSERSNS
jgi:hypothetical protein